MNNTFNHEAKMTINEYLELHKEIDYILDGKFEHRKLTPKVECDDGFSMSVQVSEGHYCSPRENNAIHYSSAEVGYPSEQEELIMPFAEEPDIPTSTVYGYVPVELIDSVIAKHGGIKT